MDCKNARLILEVAHPLTTELDSRDTADLANHLADCPDCGPWAEMESRLDDHFGAAMREVPVPDGLSQRILQRLHVERDAWYRGWTVRVAGLAATLLLAAWLGWALWWNRKPAPDIASYHLQVDQVLYKAEQVEEAFAARGVVMQTRPRKFDYRNLDSFGLADFEDRRVPHLLFMCQNPRTKLPALANVYVLSDRQFNLRDITSAQRMAGSRKNLEVIVEDANPTVAYVVIFSADAQLKDFWPPVRRATD